MTEELQRPSHRGCRTRPICWRGSSLEVDRENEHSIGAQDGIALDLDVAAELVVGIPFSQHPVGQSRPEHRPKSWDQLPEDLGKVLGRFARKRTQKVLMERKSAPCPCPMIEGLKPQPRAIAC